MKKTKKRIPRKLPTQKKSKKPPTFEKAMADWEKRTAQIMEDTRGAETLTAKDYIIIGKIRWRI